MKAQLRKTDKKSRPTSKQTPKSIERADSPTPLQRLLEIQPDILAIGPGKSLDEVLVTIAETANSLLGGNFCIVFPYDHASDRFLLDQVRSGGIPEAREFTWGEPRPRGASRTALQDGEMIIDDYGDPKYIKKYPFLRERVADGQRLGAYQDVAPVKATLGVRLQAGEEYFGVLVVNYPEPHEFQQAEIDVAKVFASQAAIAIRNGRLYERYRALIDSAESFAALRVALDPKDTLRKIMQAIHEVLDSNLTVIFPYDQKNDIFLMERLVAIGENVEDFEFEVPRAKGGTRKVLQVKEIIRYNLEDAPIEWKEPLGPGPFAQHFGIQAVAAVPLRVGEELVGVLYINYKNRHKFDQTELDLIGAFANQVALILFNTSVFEREREARHLSETLREAATDLIEAPTLEEALDKTLEQVKKVVPYDGALLMLAEGPSLVSRAAKGFELQDKVLAFTLDPAEDIIFKGHGNVTKPVFLDDVQKDPRWKPVPTVGWVHGWLGVRLFSRAGDTIGEIGLYSREEGFYNQEHAENLLSFANQAVLAIENARLLDQLRAISRIQEQVLEQSADLDRVIKTILGEALKLVGANIGQVLLLDESKTHLIISASTSPVDEERLLDINDCITGLVVKDKEHRPVVARDVTTEERFRHLYKEPEGDPAKSELAVALLQGGEIIGVLNVESKAIGTFTDYHANLLTAVANVTSSAIYTAMSVVRELDLVGQVQTAILNEAFDLNQVFHLIANNALGPTGADSAELWLVKDDKLISVAIVSPYVKPGDLASPLLIADSVTGMTCLNKKPILIGDVESEEPYKHVYKRVLGPRMRSELAVPLLVEEHVIGVINVESEKVHAFSRHHLELLQTLALEATVAIRAAQRHDELVRRRQEQETIAVIQQELLGSAFDQQQVLDGILKRGLELIEATLGQVLTVDGEKLLIRSSTLGPDVGNSVEIRNSVTGFAIKEKRPVRVNDVQSEEPYKSVYQPILGLELDFELHSELVVPLISGDDVIGALNIEDKRIGAFTDEDQSLLESLARQAALTLRLAEAFSVVETLRDVQDGILTERYNLEQASAVILNEAQRLIGAETGQILLLEDPETLVIKASTNPDEVNVTRVKVNDSVSGMAVERGEVVNVEDVTTEEPYRSRYKQFLGGNMHSELVVPLRVGEKFIGVLNVESPRIGAFTQRHVDILSTLAGQAAMAFRTAEELELRKRTSEADKMLSAGQIVHRLTGRSGAIKGWIEIIREEQDSLLKSDDIFSLAINDIELKAGEILTLVEELKQHASGQFELVEILPMLESAIERLKVTQEFKRAGEQIDIKRDLPQKLPQIRADSTLTEVFLNLLSNSVKEMPGGGAIQITADVDSESVKISFKDDGPGIPPEMHETIFNSKFSGSNEPGHGLGLWWSRAYIRTLGGDILLESEPGRGACFTVRLPISP